LGKLIGGGETEREALYEKDVNHFGGKNGPDSRTSLTQLSKREGKREWKQLYQNTRYRPSTPAPIS